MSSTAADSLAERLVLLNERIQRACVDSGRSLEEITLIGVSKTKPAADVTAANELGLHDFGENYLQEATGKIDALQGIAATWHYVGNIQSNKTKEVAKYFDWVHTVDRSKIGQRLSAQCPAGKTIQVLIQVNIDDDPNKGGCSPAQALDLTQQLTALPNLQVRGLMTILSKDSIPRDSYESVAQLSVQIAAELPAAQQACWDTLSMGMTYDLEHAIAAGATHIRIGTALFGARG